MICKLSICISTFKRADYIGETLLSILPQLTDECELLVLDGASPDNTAEVVKGIISSNPRARYIREDENSGIDADYDKAVIHARGTYCWLMTDDDLLSPGAVARVLNALATNPQLVVVDTCVMNADMTVLLEPRRMKFDGERRYSAVDRDRFMMDAGDALSFIGGTIILRDLWLARERKPYFGTVFIHVGVIFQSPPLEDIIAIGEPLVQIRLGNAMWTPRSFEIWMFKWPALIWGFGDYSPAAKAAVVAREPWRQFKKLITMRGNGAYGLGEYRRFFKGVRLGPWRFMMLLIALLPGRLSNLAGLLYLGLTGKLKGAGGYNLALCSRFAFPGSRPLIAHLQKSAGAAG